MKSIFNKIASVTMALLVLLSTMSFTVEKHYCGDFLVDVSIIGNADSCDMKIDASEMKNCCKDEVHQIEGQNELQQSSVDDFDLSKQQFLVSFCISYNDLFIENESKKIYFKDFSPPEILKNHQVLYQTFLI